MNNKIVALLNELYTGIQLSPSSTPDYTLKHVALELNTDSYLDEIALAIVLESITKYLIEIKVAYNMLNQQSTIIISNEHRLAIPLDFLQSLQKYAEVLPLLGEVFSKDKDIKKSIKHKVPLLG